MVPAPRFSIARGNRPSFRRSVAWGGATSPSDATPGRAVEGCGSSRYPRRQTRSESARATPEVCSNPVPLAASQVPDRDRARMRGRQSPCPRSLQDTRPHTSARRMRRSTGPLTPRRLHWSRAQQLVHFIHALAASEAGPASLHAVPETSYVHSVLNFATSGCTNAQSNENPAPTIITSGLPDPVQFK
jgi:hypothetical protein